MARTRVSTSSVELSVVMSVEKINDTKHDTQFNNIQHQQFLKKCDFDLKKLGDVFLKVMIISNAFFQLFVCHNYNFIHFFSQKI